MAELSLDDVMRAVADMRREMRAEIDDLRAALEALRAERQDPGFVVTGRPGDVRDAAPAISPEMLAMMAAVVTAYLGKKVRVRSARLQSSAHEAPSPWAQHGRVFVQATTHNLLHVR